MLKKILLVIAVLIIGLVIFIAIQPADFTITRSATMAAPPAEVFAQVNNFKNWETWSPWEKMDPNLKRTYGGPESGEGATYAWAGDSNVGEGNMTITESKLDELVVIRLEFIKPMAATNTTEFTFKQEGEGTAVTWTMSGNNNFVGKAFSLVMDIEEMVGGQFNQGLSNLKAVVEK